MAAAAHTPGGYGGVPQSVGKEFNKADEGTGIRRQPQSDALGNVDARVVGVQPTTASERAVVRATAKGPPKRKPRLRIGSKTYG